MNSDNARTQESELPMYSPAWDDLRLVREIARAQGMAGAAAELGLDHSTVYRRLGALEKALGTTGRWLRTDWICL